MKILNNETKITGGWTNLNGKVQKDEATVRIEWLINNKLQKIAQDTSGWDILYLDPNDNRLWELTYPDSELHGGGPPTLSFISSAAAKIKYKM